MANRYTGIEQNFNLIRESNNENITTILGNFSNISYDIVHDNELRSSIGQGAEMQEAVDGMTEIDVSLECEPPTLKALQLMGEYNENNGTWEVELTKHLPTFKAEIQATSSHVLVIEGLKFGQADISVDQDGVVEISFTDGMATYAELQETTITTPEPQDKPESFLDVTAVLDNNTVGSADSININIDRNVQSRRGIQEYDAGERRLPDEITEGFKNFSWDATVEVTDGEAFKTLFNDNTYPLTLAEFSENVPFEAVLSEESGSIELEGGKLSDLGGELINDDDVRTIELNGNGTTATIEGDL